MALSPDGRLIAVGDEEGGISLWVRSTGQRLGALSVPADLGGKRIGCLAFSPDGSNLAGAGRGHVIFIWECASRRILRQFSCDDAVEIYAVAFSPDGENLASADSGLHVWDMKTGKERFRTSKDKEAVSLAFSPDGQAIAVRSLVRPLRLFSAMTGKVLATCADSMPQMRPEYLASWGVAISRDGKHMVSAIDDGRIGIWDVAGGRKERELNGEPAFALAVAFSPDGKTLACITLGSQILLWDVQEERILSRYQERGNWTPHAEKRATVAFSPDGTVVVASTLAANNILVWDVRRILGK